MRSSLISILVVAGLCSGCKTVVIRPTPVPECDVPAEFVNACVASAAIPAEMNYGDLPDVLVLARKDFASCRIAYVSVMQSYQLCSDSLRQLNEKLKKLERESKEKYGDVKIKYE